MTPALIQPADCSRFCEYNLSTCSAPAMPATIRQHPIKVANRAPNDQQSHAFPPPQSNSARISWQANSEIDFKKPHTLAAKLRAMLGHKVKMIGNGY